MLAPRFFARKGNITIKIPLKAKTSRKMNIRKRII